jgi:hypothetical protein
VPFPKEQLKAMRGGLRAEEYRSKLQGVALRTLKQRLEGTQFIESAPFFLGVRTI